MATPSEIIEKHDKEQRLKAEEEIKSKAHALTNGDAGNPKLTGEVLEWVVTEMIELGVLIRVSVGQIALCQLKEDCVVAHKQKKWAVKVFGVSYALPVSTAIVVIGVLTYMAFHKQGLM